MRLSAMRLVFIASCDKKPCIFDSSRLGSTGKIVSPEIVKGILKYSSLGFTTNSSSEKTDVTLLPFNTQYRHPGKKGILLFLY